MQFLRGGHHWYPVFQMKGRPQKFGLYLMAYSYLDYRCLDYKKAWTIPWTTRSLDFCRLDYKNVWTIQIGLLGHLDYQKFGLRPKYTKLSFRLHPFRPFWTAQCIFFQKGLRDAVIYVLADFVR